MASVYKSLKSLDNAELQQQVVDWVIDRLGLNAAATRKNVGRSAESDERLARGNESASREGTVDNVVRKIGANSCRTLLLAAAAYLVLYQGKEKFTREELVACAKGARLWKADYGTQTSVNINRMCDSDELFEKSKDVYGLSPKKMAEVEQKLGE
jgi:hypothetical protein